MTQGAMAILPRVRPDQMELAFVPVSQMTVDPVYQREVDSRRVNKYVANWNDLAGGVLYVSKRGKQYYILDGQHRWEAAKQRKLAQLPCLVLVDLSPKVEADLFVYYNKHRRIASVVDVFRAEVAKGDPAAKSILKTLDLHGLKLGAGPGKFSSVATARKIHDRFGWEVLAAVLGTTMRAWPSDVDGATDSHIMTALTALYSHYGASGFDFATMERGLHSTTRDDIMGAVNARRIGNKSARGNVSNGVALVLMELYNSSLGRGRHGLKLTHPRSSSVFSQSIRAYGWDDGGLAGVKDL